MQCAREAGCTIPDELGKPMLSCAWFESLEGVFPGGAANPADGSEDRPNRLDGLCCDCENRESCVFRRREGGIWHCEEYR